MIGVFGLYTKDGASSFDGQFFRQVSDQFPAISAAQNAHTQAIILEVARLHTKGLTIGPTYSTFPSATICKNQSDDGQCARTKPPKFTFISVLVANVM